MGYTTNVNAPAAPISVGARPACHAVAFSEGGWRPEPEGTACEQPQIASKATTGGAARAAGNLSYEQHPVTDAFRTGCAHTVVSPVLLVGAPNLPAFHPSFA